MSWEAPVPIFEDEDENELINEFVRLSAQYGNKYTPMEIAAEVFKDLRDPYPRCLQAANTWSNSLAIKRRIDEAKATKPNKDLIQSKEDWELKMLALLDNTEIGAQEKKVRVEIMNSIAKSRGWLDSDEDGDKKAGGGVVLNFMRYSAAQPDAA